MFVPLEEAAADTCGGKAGVLGALLRAGLPVPDGCVLPFAGHDAALGDLEAVERALAQLGEPPVAVRSSAADEDTDGASAAGQYESVLAVHGVADVTDAVRTCWASLHAPRATAYRSHLSGHGAGRQDLAMAVIIQRHVDAEVAGVMFTPASPDAPTVVEASWGLGPSVVSGTVTPDTYRVHPDGTITGIVADKPVRLDRVGTRVISRDVPDVCRRHPTLDDATATELADLGRRVAAILGGPQDVEWALADGRLWLLQARPVTAAPPDPGGSTACTDPTTLFGTPGSFGTATGIARVVRGPQDFGRVRPGDILICPFTDPAWTPLLGIASGVVTETGGALSHAAIVARERHIPAVLGVRGAMTVIPDGVAVTIDGAAGVVVTQRAEPTPPAAG